MGGQIKQKVQKAYTTTTKILSIMCVWGLIFSLVTIGKLKVAFDYDDTLVNSAAAYNKAFRSGSQIYSPGFWSVVNQSYDLEKRKILPNLLAWTLRIFGFHVTIIANRPPEGGEALRKEWRWLASSFIFVPDKNAKHFHLNQGSHVLYFGDSDSDITEGRLAKVYTLRVRRSPSSLYKEDYNPGKLRELVIPFTEY